MSWSWRESDLKEVIWLRGCGEVRIVHGYGREGVIIFCLEIELESGAIFTGEEVKIREQGDAYKALMVIMMCVKNCRPKCIP